MKNFKAPIIFTLLIIVLSACTVVSGFSSPEVHTEQSVVERNVDIGKGIWKLAPAPVGVYVLSENMSLLTPTFEYNLSFIDNTGAQKSEWLHKSESTTDTRTYYGIWYSDGKIVTAYSPIDMTARPAEVVPIDEYDPKVNEVDLVFEEFDEDLNLIRSVTAGKILNIYTQSVAFDGEYFYYVSDDPTYSTSVDKDWFADAVVYRLDRDFNPAGSEAPLGDERRMARIENVITGGDGSVYIVWHESNMLYPYLYRMKKYGEGEKTIRIQYNDSVNFVPTGDSEYLFYMFHQNDELLGVSAKGKVTKIKVRDPEPIDFTTDFYNSAVIDGVRVSYSGIENAGGEIDLVRKTIEMR
jgi:hypothetical protein